MSPLRVGIAGLGAIGRSVAGKLDAGMPGLALAAVAVRDPAAARSRAQFRSPCVFTDIAGLEPQCDVVVECAPSALLADIARPMLAAGKKVLVLSVGALLRHWDLVELARETGGQIIVPTGALIGLDAVSAAAEGTIHAVRMITRKPVRGLVGAPYLVENNIAIEDIRAPLRVFAGSPRDAAVGFPANLNVAVALSLAGIGPDATQLEIWADPQLSRNTHRIEVDADSASFSMEIANIPSDNPRTGRITALSVIAALRKMTAPLRVGT
ncbi:MAG: aspartate dehydrogenase [Burkholderiales bacterium]|nr:aspartate dehydrogenase [Burkholderiales bacterium]